MISSTHRLRLVVIRQRDPTIVELHFSRSIRLSPIQKDFLTIHNRSFCANKTEKDYRLLICKIGLCPVRTPVLHFFNNFM